MIVCDSLSNSAREFMFTYHTRIDTQMLCPDLGEARSAIAPIRDCHTIQLGVDSSEIVGRVPEKRSAPKATLISRTRPFRNDW